MSGLSQKLKVIVDLVKFQKNGAGALFKQNRAACCPALSMQSVAIPNESNGVANFGGGLALNVAVGATGHFNLCDSHSKSLARAWGLSND